MSTRMQQRRGTAAQWLSTNNGNGPILAAGEIGFESDTNKFKIGDGVNHWIALTYFTDAESALASITNLVDGAPDLLNTLNELAAAIGDDPNFITTVATNLSNHESDTTNVHGISDTANLATKTYVLTEGESVISAHNQSTTNVHGISNTADLVYTSDARLSDTRTPSDSSVTEAKIANSAVTTNKINDISVTTGKIADDAVTTAKILNSNVTTDKINDLAVTEGKIASGAVTELKIGTAAVTGTKIGSGVIDNSHISTVADIAQSKINGLTSDLAAKAPLASPTFTGTVVLPSNTITETMIADGSITSAKILNGTIATDDIADSSITSAKIVNGTIVNADISSSAAIDATKISGTAITAADTGTVTSTMIADGTIVNADISASAAIAQSKIANLATDLAAKAPLAGPTFTGTVTAADITITGNLTVSGTTTTVNTTNFTTSDPVIYLADGNNANTVDLGFVASYNDGTYAHQGLVKDSSDAKWKLFKGVTDEPTTTVNFAQGSLDALAVGAFEASSATIGNVSNTELQYLDGVTSAIQTQINSKAPINAPTFTGAVTLSSSGIVFIDGTQTKVGVPSITTFATAISSNATVAEGEQDKFVPLTGAVTITLPSTGYVKGQSIDFYQESGTGAQFASTNGVVGTPGLKFRTTNSVATAMRLDSGWLVFGDLSA